MAKTTFLKVEVENWIRKHLFELHGQPFRSALLKLQPGGNHEFDAVSEDDQIVCSIKTSSGLTSGGNIPQGKLTSCITEIYYLNLIQAQSSQLILTNEEFFRIFQKTTEGKIAEGVVITHLGLPPQMQLKVDEVIRKASDEMRRP